MSSPHRAIDRFQRRALLAVALVGSVSIGCGSREKAVAPEPEPWSVTAWGERYEVFPEVDPLIAGQASAAHTHVTVLDGFTAPEDGSVEIVLRGAAGEQVFSAAAPVRPGIWSVELHPTAAGEYDLAFRIRSAAGEEEIAGGTVRVGDEAAPGGVVRTSTPPESTAGGEPVPFLKEQQWKTSFATDWVRQGSLAASVRGLTRVRAPAGGEAVVTAPVEGIARPEPWPFPGQEVKRGAVLFQLEPLIASDRSLPELEGEIADLEAQNEAARARLARLEELLKLEAASRREVDEARAQVASLEARIGGRRRDLAAAVAGREGGPAAYSHALRAPWAGKVVSVAASPGAMVHAGTELARLVKTGPIWLEVDLSPADARRAATDGVAGALIELARDEQVRLEGGQVRLVSIAPTVDAAKGTVTAILEAAGDLPLGATVETEVLLAGEREGIVIPATALIDDGGVYVVYLQNEGERFARQPVDLLSRQGDRLLVDGLIEGQRLVTRGGDAIRRASLLATGAPEGHVH